MKLIYFKFLNEYLIFKKDQTFHFNEFGTDNHQRGHWNYKVITGSNGSGKSLLLSSISRLFHNIDRYHNRLEFECEISYNIQYGESIKNVILRYYKGKYSITIEGEFNNTTIKPLNPRTLKIKEILKKLDKEIPNKLVNENNEVEFYHIKSYLPTSVVLSTFSIHGEYPSNRNYNYKGNPIIKSFDISGVYGMNHFGLPSITRGISRFLKIYYDDNVTNKIDNILSTFGFKYSEKVKVKDGNLISWITVNKENHTKYVNLSEGGDIYLNDILFNRNGRDINFENMSTGEKMLIFRIISILSEIENESIIIVEEPELHLDFSWNRQLYSLFKCFFKTFNSQFIVISHHPFIINSIKKEQLLVLNNGAIEEPSKNTFLTSTEELFDLLYGDKYFINKTEESILNLISETNSKKKLEKLIDNLGNSIYKLIALEKLNSLK